MNGRYSMLVIPGKHTTDRFLETDLPSNPWLFRSPMDRVRLRERVRTRRNHGRRLIGLDPQVGRHCLENIQYRTGFTGRDIEDPTGVSFFMTISMMETKSSISRKSFGYHCKTRFPCLQSLIKVGMGPIAKRGPVTFAKRRETTGRPELIKYRSPAVLDMP